MKVTDVAVAVFLKPDGSFLLSSRPDGKPYAGYWEFPGGKFEPGETAAAALKREILEELNVVVDEAHPWFSFVISYPHGTVRLHQWRVTAWHDADAGLPNASGMRGMEGQQFAWQPSVAAIDVAPTLPGCVPIFRALSLPTRYLVTNASEVGAEVYLKHLRAFWGKNAPNTSQNGEFLSGLTSHASVIPAQAGIYNPPGRSAPTPNGFPRARERQQMKFAIQIREKAMPPRTRLAFAREVTAIAREHGHLVFVNSDVALAESLKADGVHLTGADLATIAARPALEWVGASVHSRAELDHAAALKCDFAMLGAVKQTASHPGVTPIGWSRFREIVDASPIPVIAIGGLHEEDFNTAWQHGAHGIAMQRGAW